jgi:hypothetical protein
MHDDQGEAVRNPFSPEPTTKWSTQNETAWRLALPGAPRSRPIFTYQSPGLDTRLPQSRHPCGLSKAAAAGHCLTHRRVACCRVGVVVPLLTTVTLNHFVAFCTGGSKTEKVTFHDIKAFLLAVYAEEINPLNTADEPGGARCPPAPALAHVPHARTPVAALCAHVAA